MTNRLPFSKISKISQIFFLLFIFFSLLISHTAQLQAADKQSIVALPPRKGHLGDLHAAPGEKIQTSIRFRNASEQTLEVTSYVQDFIVKEDGSTPIAVEETVSNRWSMADWMVVTPNKQKVGPSEIVEMNVLIEIPEDATPGGHYAMILHQPTNVIAETMEQSSSSGAAINQKVGTLFYVTVEGDVNEEAYLRSFQFNKFQEFGPVPFSFNVSNQSDIHIHPRMNIDIFNMLGQKVDSLKVEARNVFPFNDREFAGKWDKTWGFGLYKAKLTMSYGEAGKIAMANANFWIIPVRIIIAIIIILLIILAIIFAIKRYIRHQSQAEHQELEQLKQELEQYKEQDKQINS